MSGLDRDSEPGMASSSKQSASKPRPPGVFPSLKRVHRKLATSESVGSVVMVTRRDINTSSGESWDDCDVSIQEKSTTQHGTLGSSSTSDLDGRSLVERHSTDDSRPRWPNSQMPKSRPETPELASSQEMQLNFSPTLTAKTRKRGSIEKSRQDRSAEDDRLVEEASRQVQPLIHQSRQNRSREDGHCMETTLKQNAAMIHMIDHIAKTAAAQAPKISTTRAVPSSTNHTTDKRPAWHVGSGRITEREGPSKRSLVITDSPKPPAGGKAPAQLKTKTNPSITTGKSARAPAVTPSRPITRSTPKVTLPKVTLPKVTVSKASLPIIRKQRSTIPSKESPKKVESKVKGRAEKKPAIELARKERSSAPSPDDFLIVTGHSSIESEEVTSEEPCSLVSAPDLFKHSRETDENSGSSELIDIPSRSGSSTWTAPVYRPKTRLDHDDVHEGRERPVRPRRKPVAADPKAAEKPCRELPLLLSEVLQPTLDLPDPMIPITPESGPIELHDEKMSPIDLGKVSSLRRVSDGTSKFIEWRKGVCYDIGGPIELTYDRAEDSNESNEAEKETLEFQSRLDTVQKALLNFHSKVDSSERVPDIDAIQWHDSLSLRFKKNPPPMLYSEPDTDFQDRKSQDRKSQDRKSEDFYARLCSQKAPGLSNPSSFPELQHQAKAPLSCLTGSHRGRRLHVSFASSEQMGDSTAADTERKDSEKALEAPSNPDHNPSRGGFVSYQDPSYLDLTADDMVEQTGSNTRMVETENHEHRKYRPEDYRKAKKGLEKAKSYGNLLIESKSPDSEKPSGQQDNMGDVSYLVATRFRLDKEGKFISQLDDATRFILEVKKRFRHQPEIFRKFLELLDSCEGRGSIGRENARYVDAEVSKLLADNPDLLEGFKRFRPVRKTSSPKKDSESARLKSSSNPRVVNWDVPDTKQDGTPIQSPQDMNEQVQLNKGKQNDVAGSLNEIDRLVECLRQSDMDRQIKMKEKGKDEVGEIDRLIETLRQSAKANGIVEEILGQSAKARGIQPDQTRSTVPRTKKDQAKFNPAAAEFKPLFGAFQPPTPTALWPQLSQLQPAGSSSLNGSNQIQKDGFNENAGPIFAPVKAEAAMRSRGYHTMPNRTTKHFEAMKKALASAENLQPVAFHAPMNMNGTTYYTLPEDRLSVEEPSLPGASGKDCQIGFSKHAVAIHGGSLRSVQPRKPHFGRNNQNDPLWMYTPLVPIRKGTASGSGAENKDPSEESGLEAKRLDDYVAKMKLDEFTSRFPMTGRKAEVVTNMKQKFAAEIQHRLELVLYEKKEKEAAARQLSGIPQATA